MRAFTDVWGSKTLG